MAVFKMIVVIFTAWIDVDSGRGFRGALPSLSPPPADKMAPR